MASKKSSSKSGSAPSQASQNPDAPTQVSAETASLVAGSDAAQGVKPQAGDRTADEKVKALGKVSDSMAKVDQKATAKTLPELATGSGAEQSRAILWILEFLERRFGIDYVREAAPSEVLSGEADLRAALSPDKESPHRVDDAVVPSGMNNPTDELLPPNILSGEPPKDFAKHPAVVAAGEPPDPDRKL